MRWKSTGEAEINIGVLGSRNDVLWEFRDFLIGLEAELDYKISMMLAKNQETLLRVMSFVPGGFDIIIVTDHLPGFVYLEMTEKAFAFNAEVKILFQMDRGIEFSDKLYPHALCVPGREQLKSLAKEKMDDMITKNSEKGAAK